MPLPLEGLVVPPPDSEECEPCREGRCEVMEHISRRGVTPFVGGDSTEETRDEKPNKSRRVLPF